MAMNLVALQYRDFRIYALGNLFALNGLWIQRVTIGWLAWQLTGSAAYVGLIAFLSFAPTIVTGPFFGVLADRVRLKPAALLAQIVLTLMAITLFASYQAGWLGTGVLAVYSTVAGVVSSAYNPVRMSLAPRLVPRGAVASVVTLTAINFNLARLFGPAIGGVLIAQYGVGPTLLAQFLCNLPFVVALAKLSPHQQITPASGAEPFLSAMRAGLSYSFRNRLIRQAILTTGIFAFVIRGVLEILPVLADGVFDKGAAGLGLLTSAAGAGALLAGLTKAFLPAQAAGRLPRFALLAGVVGIVLVPVLGAAGDWLVTAALVSGLGFTSSISAISMQTAIQIELSDELRGRVMSLWIMVGIGAAAIGAVALGSLVDIFGFGATLGLSGAIGLVLMLMMVRDVLRTG